MKILTSFLVWHGSPLACQGFLRPVVSALHCSRVRPTPQGVHRHKETHPTLAAACPAALYYAIATSVMSSRRIGCSMPAALYYAIATSVMSSCRNHPRADLRTAMKGSVDSCSRGCTTIDTNGKILITNTHARVHMDERTDGRMHTRPAAAVPVASIAGACCRVLHTMDHDVTSILRCSSSPTNHHSLSHITSQTRTEADTSESISLKTTVSDVLVYTFSGWPNCSAAVPE